ncbi:MAG TPA: Crp/Fnr family transcriptional regulator [Candidatus Hydrogenedentes bacterium]|jgi:CRP/FNR family transcriptional regulator|nr:MAG: cAMP receptor protein [Candidatus Hydrogenedentes bacterium ADurb.Bin170]HNZ47809.1 Crp/Fnr family transcriptional regulator [Candidatus Hydrogenedentota bacterium]HOD95784.1 Crp/Fnr family transcriptional regulator [Candidatus Hydrogenedentota bacterium]HOH41772.1 Crp/Fnr family transcriptional regulator [Candidatus Hydrogenedentota bacterium]HOM48092.1 Crp/Fnr family transcriptional regulator [Candidatus Hydrogenedentota bacterium]
MKRVTAPLEQRLIWLQGCPLFAEVAPEHLKDLAGLMSIRRYEPGETVFQEGDTADGLYIIVDGQVKIGRYAPDGREQVLHIFEEGEPLGEAAMFEGGHFPATAQTLTAATILFLLRADFLYLAEKKPALLLNLLAVLSRRLRRFVQMIDDLALKEVSTRLAKHLLELSEEADSSHEVFLTTSKTMLAARLGAVAETLSRTLARMQRRGIIQVDGRRVLLKNREALEALAEGEKL